MTESPRSSAIGYHDVRPDGTDRHPAVAGVLRYFSFDHLPEGPLRATSEACAEVAYLMANDLPESAELTAGLRKLLEAKDCFVRAALDL